MGAVLLTSSQVSRHASKVRTDGLHCQGLTSEEIFNIELPLINMAEVAAGALVAEQVISTTIEGGVIAGYAISKPTMPLKASFMQIATAPKDDSPYVLLHKPSLGLHLTNTNMTDSHWPDHITRSMSWVTKHTSLVEKLRLIS